MSPQDVLAEFVCTQNLHDRWSSAEVFPVCSRARLSVNAGELMVGWSFRSGSISTHLCCFCLWNAHRAAQSIQVTDTHGFMLLVHQILMCISLTPKKIPSMSGCDVG